MWRVAPQQTRTSLLLLLLCSNPSQVWLVCTKTRRREGSLLCSESREQQPWEFYTALQAKCEQRKVQAQLRLTLAKASREVHHQVEEAVAHRVERNEVAYRCTYNQRVNAGVKQRVLEVRRGRSVVDGKQSVAGLSFDSRRWVD